MMTSTNPHEPTGLSVLNVPSETNTTVLADNARQELINFLNDKNHNPSYGYELFRLAFADQNEAALGYVMDIYRPLVIGWIEKRPQSLNLTKDVEHLVNDAFFRMWNNLRKKGKFEQFHDLPSLFQYLKMCTGSSIAQTQSTDRPYNSLDDTASHASTTDSLESLFTIGNDTPNIFYAILATPQDIEKLRYILYKHKFWAILIDCIQNEQIFQKYIHIYQNIYQKIYRNTVWQRIIQCLHNARELLVLYDYYVLCFIDREIADRYPEFFKNASQVANIRWTLLRRLKKCPGLEDFFRDFIIES